MNSLGFRILSRSQIPFWNAVSRNSVSILPLAPSTMGSFEDYGTNHKTQIVNESPLEADVLIDYFIDYAEERRRTAPPYIRTGPNSNTTVKVLLEDHQIIWTPLPDYTSPGWKYSWEKPAWVWF